MTTWLEVIIISAFVVALLFKFDILRPSYR